jgi:hypothetical protein
LRGAKLSWLLAACALALLRCNTADPGAGSNTNWLRPCLEDDECRDGLSCLCGICTAPCDAECSELPRAICAPAGSASHAETCGEELGQVLEPAGLCLPACGPEAACAAGQLCKDGGCLQLAAADDADTGCRAVSLLELSAGGLELQARHGTLFGDALYLPVAYEERPASWVEPMSPAPIVARATDAAGETVAGCQVRFITGEGSGSAFADTRSTDLNGEVTAYWVAGEEREQVLSAAIVGEGGRVMSADLPGTAFANDEGPQATDAAVNVARPATLRLNYAPPDTATLLRVRIGASSFPHHAFYAALTSEGFFSGLQNTSDLDALSEDVPSEDRILIASVWHTADTAAELLFQVEGLECGPHYQETGGIRCTLGSAWVTGAEYFFTLERTSLLQGESGPGYAELGYLDTPCASAAGCTDYTLYFADATDEDSMQRVVAYRYQAVVGNGFGSFVQPYIEIEGQNSCLATPRYEATFSPYALVDGTFERVEQAGFSANYQTWHNEVCANYAAATDVSGFQLITGGPEVLDRPELPGDPARELSLP